jgi:hypothetical protein
MCREPARAHQALAELQVELIGPRWLLLSKEGEARFVESVPNVGIEAHQGRSLLEPHGAALLKDRESVTYDRMNTAEEHDHLAVRRHHPHLLREPLRVGSNRDCGRSLGIDAGLSKQSPQLLPSGTHLGAHHGGQSPQFIETRPVERALGFPVRSQPFMVDGCVRPRNTDISAIWLSANLLGSRFCIGHRLKRCLFQPVPCDLPSTTCIVSPDGHGIDRAVGMSEGYSVPPTHGLSSHGEETTRRYPLTSNKTFLTSAALRSPFTASSEPGHVRSEIVTGVTRPGSSLIVVRLPTRRRVAGRTRWRAELWDRGPKACGYVRPR